MSDVTAFLTDSTLCIGCKACEVACKEWNQVPEDGFTWHGMSYDNTGGLGHSTWRHVKFVENGASPASAAIHPMSFPGDFRPTFVSTARMPDAWKPAPRARSSALNSAASTFSRMYAMAVRIVSSTVRSEWSNAIPATAARSNARFAMTARKRGSNLPVPPRVRLSP